MMQKNIYWFLSFAAWVFPPIASTGISSHETPFNKSENDFPHVASALDFACGLINDVKKMTDNPMLIQRNFDISDHRTHDCSKPMDCSEVLVTKGQQHKSGPYNIWPRSRLTGGHLKVFCDMEDDGGGWTLIQRRGDFDSGKDYFYQDWNYYKRGFGDIRKDFWIGNDNLFALTNQRENVIKFVLSDWEGNTTYATYDEFWTDDELHNYTMHVKRYRGTAGDAFTRHDGEAFSTKDRDNDSSDTSCSIRFRGAWWYTNCLDSNLNGIYLKGEHNTTADGVNWRMFRGLKYSLKHTVMKIRPTNFR